MKIVIPGGTGQVGQILARYFAAGGHEVVLLARSQRQSTGRTVLWDGRTVGTWSAELEGADVVINLAGRSVDCRYNSANRGEILRSRVDSTRVLGEVISGLRNPPRVWLQAGTATIYAHRFDGPNDEQSGIIGGDEPVAQDTWRFSVEVAKAWEDAFQQAPTLLTRKVIMRSAMVMSPDAGGIFRVLLRLVKLGLGGPVGGGDQYVSWIHDVDFIRSVQWLLDHEEFTGAVNLSSPEPLPFRDFMRLLRRAARVPIGLPATRWMAEIGSFLLRTETELVLKSRRVVPGRLLQAGFTFQMSDWSPAAEDLCRRASSLR